MGQKEIYEHLNKNGKRMSTEEIALEMGVNPQSATMSLTKMWRFKLVNCELAVVRKKPRKYARVWYIE